MREEFYVKGSHGKGRVTERPSSQLTDTPSQTVNSCDFVNSLLTLRRFKAELQRVSKEHRAKAEEVAELEGRKTFNDVLDVYEFCYDFMKDLSRRLGVPLYRVPEELERYLPQDIEDLITIKVAELLETFNIDNGNEGPVATAISKILREVVKKKRPASEVVRPILVLDSESEA